MSDIECSKIKITVVDNEAFNLRYNYIQHFIDFMIQVVDEMVEMQQIEKHEAHSLCLTDDTAAWLCGRVETAHFVSFRLKSALFTNSCLLSGFDSGFEQKLLGDSWTHLTYYNTSFDLENQVAIRLIISRMHLDTPLEMSNPCPQLAYFVRVSDKRVTTRDCDCFRLQTLQKSIKWMDMIFDLQPYDENNSYHKMLVLQTELIESMHDDNIVSIVCRHKN
ncbi:LEF-12 [Clanis bilineata nucleopolyhedrovirus]|uniref:LEF-12 n=1 Tax=Clanis bilineata nucleopolyhedrovirus TaxID=1307957 RepID=Q0N466_9ABAC|nr:LEF-12 [Clanis bilineata nucleopolyhedrovirus]ABF47377.1 LEF-12 [Clanis bilineata nucleopolyhedrovirus]